MRNQYNFYVYCIRDIGDETAFLCCEEIAGICIDINLEDDNIVGDRFRHLISEKSAFSFYSEKGIDELEAEDIDFSKARWYNREN